MQANRSAFDRWYLRPGRMVDVTHVDTSLELLGARWPTPIVLAPVGSQKAFHPDGELASARAARAANHLQILSSVTSTSIEEVGAARQTPLWYQLYPTSRWEIAAALVRRATAAGAAAIVVTVDYPGQPNRETQYKAARFDSRNCKQCHTDPTGDMRRKPMYSGTDVTIEEFYATNLTWDIIGRIRELTPRPILIKGILTAQDAAACVSHGADGVIVSNHGGRTIESLRGTISCLPEIVSAVGGEDSGSHRWRVPARHRRLQGAGAGGRRDLRGASLHLGPGGVRPGRRGAGAGAAARRAGAHHEVHGSHVARRHQSCPAGRGLTERGMKSGFPPELQRRTLLTNARRILLLLVVLQLPGVCDVLLPVLRAQDAHPPSSVWWDSDVDREGLLTLGVTAGTDSLLGGGLGYGVRMQGRVPGSATVWLNHLVDDERRVTNLRMEAVAWPFKGSWCGGGPVMGLGLEENSRPPREGFGGHFALGADFTVWSRYHWQVSLDAMHLFGISSDTRNEIRLSLAYVHRALTR